MNRKLLILSALSGLLALPSLESEADAYCLLDDESSREWAAQFDGPIPVWVSDSNGYSTRIRAIDLDMANGTFSNDDEVEWIRTAIDIFNASSHGGEKFYFAGYDSSVRYGDGNNAWATRRRGVTIQSYGPCWAAPSTGAAGTTISGDKASIKFRRGGSMTCPNPDGTPADTYLWWADPENNSTPDVAVSIDFVGVLLHEFGHVMGLNHTNTATQLCYGGNTQPSTKNAVMSVSYSGSTDWRRRLRRDDIEGLRALWGKPDRELLTAVKTEGGPWGSLEVVGEFYAKSQTPPALSNASQVDANGRFAAAYTDADDQIRLLLGENNDWTASEGFGGETISAGLSQPIRAFDPVAVARGSVANDPASDRVMVAWYGGVSSYEEKINDTSKKKGRIRFRVQRDGQWLAPQRTAQTRAKNVSLGYDPATDLFVMAYLDTCKPDAEFENCIRRKERPEDQVVYVRTVKAWLGGGGCVQALTTVAPVIEVGSISCNRGVHGSPSQCRIPVTTARNEGPLLTFIEGRIEAHDGSTCFVRKAGDPTDAGLYSYGKFASAMEPVGSSRTMLVAHQAGLADAFNPGDVPGQTGMSTVFSMGSDSQHWVDGAPTDELIFDTDYWPMAVGGTRLSNESHWRLLFAQ